MYVVLNNQFLCKNVTFTIKYYIFIAIILTLGMKMGNYKFIRDLNVKNNN